MHHILLSSQLFLFHFSLSLICVDTFRLILCKIIHSHNNQHCTNASQICSSIHLKYYKCLEMLMAVKEKVTRQFTPFYFLPYTKPANQCQFHHQLALTSQDCHFKPHKCRQIIKDVLISNLMSFSYYLLTQVLLWWVNDLALLVRISLSLSSLINNNITEVQV